MTFDSWPNLTAMFFSQAERLGDRPFLWQKRGGAWTALTWRETAEQVRALAGALRGWGLAPGDRVVLCSENAPHWAVADFAIMAAGGVTVPAYTTNTVRDHEHVLTDSGARIAVVSSGAPAKRLLEAAGSAPALERVVAVERQDSGAAVAVTGWDEALAAGAGAALDDPASIDGGALACLIYTSGTGGAPKGVMLSHRAILANCVGAHDLLVELGLGDEVFLSFLPLSHAYEHSCGLMFPAAVGAQIYYAESIEALSANLGETRADDHDRRTQALRNDAPADSLRGGAAGRAQGETVPSRRRTGGASVTNRAGGWTGWANVSPTRWSNGWCATRCARGLAGGSRRWCRGGRR